MVVEGFHYPLHHEIGHGGVDLAGQFDEAGGDVVFPGLAGEVEGVDGDAVAAQARAGEKGHEAEGLGGGGPDYLVDIDVHPQAEHFQFVDQGDVDAAEDVFQQLGHLGGFGGAYRHQLLDGPLVKGGARLQAGRGVAADHLGDVAGVEVLAAGVFPLRGIDQEEVLAHLAAGGFDAGQQFFFGGARVGGAFQGHHLAGAQVGGQGVHRVGDVAQIRLAVFIERGGHADDQGVGFGGPGEISGGLAAGLAGGGDAVGGDMFDIALAGVDFFNLAGVNINAQYLEADTAEAQQQRQADIAQADNGDGGLAGGKAGFQGF